jgi:hypothetical protein
MMFSKMSIFAPSSIYKTNLHDTFLQCSVFYRMRERVSPTYHQGFWGPFAVYRDLYRGRARGGDRDGDGARAGLAGNGWEVGVEGGTEVTGADEGSRCRPGWGFESF